MNRIDSEIIKLLKNKINPETSLLLLLKKEWKNIIGEKLYLSTEPAFIHNNILTIYCAHQGYAQSIQYVKEELLNVIYKITEIKPDDIKFKITDLSWKKRRQDIQNRTIELSEIKSKSDLIDGLKRLFHT